MFCYAKEILPPLLFVWQLHKPLSLCELVFCAGEKSCPFPYSTEQPGSARELFSYWNFFSETSSYCKGSSVYHQPSEEYNQELEPNLTQVLANILAWPRIHHCPWPRRHMGHPTTRSYRPTTWGSCQLSRLRHWSWSSRRGSADHHRTQLWNQEVSFLNTI